MGPGGRGRSMAFRDLGEAPDRLMLSEMQVLLERYLSTRVPLDGGSALCRRMRCVDRIGGGS